MTTTNTFCTADASSDIEKRVKEAIDKASANLNTERLQHLQEVKRHADDLRKRGLLRQQAYSSPSSADFRRLYPPIR